MRADSLLAKPMLSHDESIPADGKKKAGAGDFVPLSSLIVQNDF